MAVIYRFAAPKAAYTLTWPHAVLRSELVWLLREAPDLDEQAAQFLLEEAFVSDEPRDEFAALPAHGGFGTFGGFGQGATPEEPLPGSKTRMMTQLLDSVDTLPTAAAPRPYWNQRHFAASPPTVAAPEQEPGHRLQVSWAHLVEDFLDRGYLGRVAPAQCVDGDERPPRDILNERLLRVLGISDLWPLKPGTWNEDTFFSLVEAVGDLMARPRHRTYHDYARCGWHYSQFATTPGQALYRAQVNALLVQYSTGLQLADTGEDVGRLVRIASAGQEDLLKRALAVTDGPDRDAVAHATALFRSRAAGREDKRSAVVALGRLLEDRRALLKTELFRKDEGALFQIANEFDVRHREAKQRPDYDEAFLEWFFWWYLATLELTNQILARQGDAQAHPS